MQYLKIYMPKEKNTLQYPAGYSDLENFIVDHLFVDEKVEDAEEKTFLCVAYRDGVNHEVILGDLSRVDKLTREEIVEYCTPYEEIKETITDDARVRRLAIKAQLGEEFTELEKKALDPEDETPGFSLCKRFVDRI